MAYVVPLVVAVGAKPTPIPCSNSSFSHPSSSSSSSSSTHFRTKPRTRPVVSVSEKPTPSTSTTKKKEEEEYQIVTAMNTEYNHIVILDTHTSRCLLLDDTHTIHSIFNKDGMNWTGAVWDEFATLPPIVPEGPIAILGLGGGTAAHLMLELWPSLKIEGWEIDSILIDQSREYLGLSDIEQCNQAGGLLSVHVGDALSPSASVPGGFAGIVVDLFSDGKVLPQLEEVTTWLELNEKLMSHGRIMVNCGGADAANDYRDGKPKWSQNSTIKALCSAFPGKVSWKKMAGEGENYLALTGPHPDLDEWSAAVPESLSLKVKQWRPCHTSA